MNKPETIKSDVSPVASNDLLSCPFCGSDDIKMFEDECGQSFVAHICESKDISIWVKYISISTEGHNTRSDAILAWNKRSR